MGGLERVGLGDENGSDVGLKWLWDWELKREMFRVCLGAEGTETGVFRSSKRKGRTDTATLRQSLHTRNLGSISVHFGAEEDAYTITECTRLWLVLEPSECIDLSMPQPPGNQIHIPSHSLWNNIIGIENVNSYLMSSSFRKIKCRLETNINQKLRSLISLVQIKAVFGFAFHKHFPLASEVEHNIIFGLFGNDKSVRFIMECLMEFYASYDDISLTWKGVDLLTRESRSAIYKEFRIGCRKAADDTYEWTQSERN
ncbi:hypothetical protein Tco_1037458 [Tanacetum coccineum]